MRITRKQLRKLIIEAGPLEFGAGSHDVLAELSAAFPLKWREAAPNRTSFEYRPRRWNATQVGQSVKMRLEVTELKDGFGADVIIERSSAKYPVIDKGSLVESAYSVSADPERSPVIALQLAVQKAKLLFQRKSEKVIMQMDEMNDMLAQL